jgi:hypothetical protein
MPKTTKIGFVREELSRIAILRDRQDVTAPTMNASWSFTQVFVFGKMQMRSFDFDRLVEILKTIPSGAVPN